jgi:hypothetical protein
MSLNSKWLNECWYDFHLKSKVITRRDVEDSLDFLIGLHLVSKEIEDYTYSDDESYMMYTQENIDDFHREMDAKLKDEMDNSKVESLSPQC